jgi:hypothetical protein
MTTVIAAGTICVKPAEARSDSVPTTSVDIATTSSAQAT